MTDLLQLCMLVCLQRSNFAALFTFQISSHFLFFNNRQLSSNYSGTSCTNVIDWLNNITFSMQFFLTAIVHAASDHARNMGSGAVLQLQEKLLVNPAAVFGLFDMEFGTKISSIGCPGPWCFHIFFMLLHFLRGYWQSNFNLRVIFTDDFH